MIDTAPTNGLHHVTAVCSDAAENVRFYTRELGLRLVKKTVNFDDPGTYHLYYGDESGAPGSALTFFPFQGVAQGRSGVGGTTAIGFAVPKASIAYWVERLSARNIAFARTERFGESVLTLHDPDGLTLELVGQTQAFAPGWSDETSPDRVPAEHALRGFSGVTLSLRDEAPTARVLTQGFGYTRVAEENGIVRYRADGDADAVARHIDLAISADGAPERPGAGTVHHIAVRAADDDHEMALRRQLLAAGLQPTPQIDRTYFHSVYAREPGGVLLEIATDAPGFALDEDEAALGQALMLPPQYEAHRDAITRALPPLD